MDSEFIRKNKKKRRRPRNITFFNPLFCNSVKTKFGNQMFNLVNLHFPKSSKLSKIFSKNTIKLTYSRLLNIKYNINSHSRKIIKEKKISTRDCNCRDKTKCPFDGYFLPKCIYKATIYSPKGNKEYVESTGVSFKSRFS